ncbi:organic cation transporter [Danaus plexippus plexippus]|uniref:Organic cation transporter n=1 Tax=Danaus plexippus plexippus TaxID=278856 RepID=A0A212F830_DANPL|nr:organic cation transporter [Danaus plexippus plexippus]
MSKKEFDLDGLLLEIGQFGRYQVRNYCLILLPILFSAVHVSQFIFTTAELNARYGRIVAIRPFEHFTVSQTQYGLGLG